MNSFDMYYNKTSHFIDYRKTQVKDPQKKGYKTNADMCWAIYGIAKYN